MVVESRPWREIAVRATPASQQTLRAGQAGIGDGRAQGLRSLAKRTLQRGGGGASPDLSQRSGGGAGHLFVLVAESFGEGGDGPGVSACADRVDDAHEELSLQPSQGLAKCAVSR